MARSLLALSCLLLAASGVSSQPFFFGNNGGFFGNPLFGGLGQPSSRQNSSTFHRFATNGLQSGLNFAGSGLSAVSSMSNNIPVFGSGFSAMANMANHGLGTIGAFGMGGLNGMETHRQSMMSSSPGVVSQSFSSHSSSSQSGSNPPKTVTSSVTTITKS